MATDPRFLACSGPEVFIGNELLVKGALETEGGVGLMTVAVLLQNTVTAAKRLAGGYLSINKGQLAQLPIVDPRQLDRRQRRGAGKKDDRPTAENGQLQQGRRGQEVGW